MKNFSLYFRARKMMLTGEHRHIGFATGPDAQPQTPPDAPQTPERADRNRTPEQRAADRRQGADKAADNQKAKLNAAMQGIEKFRNVPADPDVGKRVDASIAELDTFNNENGISVDAEISGGTIEEAVAVVRRKNPDNPNAEAACQLALNNMQSVRDGLSTAQTQPDSATVVPKFEELQRKLDAGLRKVLTLALTVPQGNSSGPDANQKGPNDISDADQQIALLGAQNIAKGFDLKTATEQKINQKMGAMMYYFGVSVTVEGDKFKITAPTTRLEKGLNILSGIVLSFQNALPKKDDKPRSQSASAEQLASAAGEKKDAPATQSELQKEIKDKTLTVVRDAADKKVSDAEKKLEGDPPGTGLKKDLENLGVREVKLKARIKELTDKKDPTTADKEELTNKKADMVALETDKKAVQDNIDLYQKELTESKKKVEDIKTLVKTTDKKILKIKRDSESNSARFKNPPLNQNPDALVLATALDDTEFSMDMDTVEMTVTKDDASWNKMIDLAVKNGIDRKAFDLNGNKPVSLENFEKGLADLVAKLDEAAQKVDTLVKTFTDKGAKLEDAKAAAKLDVQYKLNMKFEGNRFIIPNESDNQAVQAYIKEDFATMNSAIKTALRSHIDNAISDLKSKRGQDALMSLLAARGGPFSDPKVGADLIQLASTIKVIIGMQTDNKLGMYFTIPKADAQATELYKSGRMHSALKDFIDDKGKV